MAGFTGVKREREPSPRVDHDAAARIADMDYEGVDVNLTLPSGWFGTWTTGDDVGARSRDVSRVSPLDAGLLRATTRSASAA